MLTLRCVEHAAVTRPARTAVRRAGAGSHMARTSGHDPSRRGCSISREARRKREAERKSREAGRAEIWDGRERIALLKFITQRGRTRWKSSAREKTAAER